MAASSSAAAKTASVIGISAETLGKAAGLLQYHEDFPKPGITFVDFFPIFSDPALVKALAAEHAAWFKKSFAATHVAGLDSRGFLLGPMIAAEMGIPFVPIRKKGKLPGECFGTDYDLEYGSASIQVQKHAVPKDAVFIVIDDLLATGGTLAAAVSLLTTSGATVAAACVVIALSDLQGANKVPTCPVYTMLNITDDEALAAAKAAAKE
jgi:adenine phosphoribosyltransferase